MTNGEELVMEYGSDINVAIAWIKGELPRWSRIYDVVNQTTVAAARARLELVAAGIIEEPLDKSE